MPQRAEKAVASFLDLPQRAGEIPRIPGVVDLLPRLSRPGKQQGELPLRISAVDMPHIPHILVIHADDIIILPVVRPDRLPGRVRTAGVTCRQDDFSYLLFGRFQC